MHSRGYFQETGGEKTRLVQAYKWEMKGTAVRGMSAPKRAQCVLPKGKVNSKGGRHEKKKKEIQLLSPDEKDKKLGKRKTQRIKKRVGAQ